MMTVPSRLGVEDNLTSAVDRFTASDVATVIAAVAAALIAAVVAVVGYTQQQRAARRDQRAAIYAEALRAVEDYLEGPYRIRRRDGTAQARQEIARHLSDIKSRINFHSGWLLIHAPGQVSSAYETYVRAAQLDAGPQMTAAWRSRPTKPRSTEGLSVRGGAGA